jgi:pilus assembly protein CpaE
MNRSISATINCRTEAVAKTFEDILRHRHNYLVANEQSTEATDLLLLEWDELNAAQSYKDIQALLKRMPKVEIFLVGSRMDPQILLEVFRVGVKEFLLQPLNHHEVESALARFEGRFNERGVAEKGQPGRVIAVIGARGGVGTSTVATNLAASARLVGEKNSVVLVDLDMHGGDLGLFLDLHPTQGVRQLSVDLSRIDETIVMSCIQEHASGVHFLASGCSTLEEVAIMRGSVGRVVSLLRSMYRYVFIDCGHVMEHAVKEALDCSDQIILLTGLSLPGIRRTQRILNLLSTAEYPPGKINVVVNRYHADQKEIAAEAESALGVRFAGMIPNDYWTASEALDHGKPLSLNASNTTVGQWYLHRASQIVSSKNTASAKLNNNKDTSFLSRVMPYITLQKTKKSTAV